MYIVTVEFELDPNCLDSFRAAVLEQAENSLRQEPGCLQFDVCFDPDRGTYCFLYEKYENRQAFDHHLKSHHFRNFDAIVRPWITHKTVMTLVDATTAPGPLSASELKHNKEN